MLTNIVDGWILNPSIRYLPYRAMPMLLGQMEALRRAHNLRNRMWVLPDNVEDSIPARGKYERQIRVTPGSYLWGMTFYKFIDNFGALFTPVAPDDLSFQVTDDATGVQISSEFLSARAFWPGAPSARTTTPVLLTQPKLIVGQGLLAVEIANTNASPAFVQLCMYFLEPCELSLDPKGDTCP